MKWAYGKLSDYSEAEFEAAYKEMSASRKARVDRLKSDKDRLRSILGEILVKKLLSEEGIYAVLESDSGGRPYLKDSNYFVSISHSGEMAVCAISEKAVGIDVEKLKPVDLKMVRRVCTDREKEYIENGDDMSLRFLEIWTAKEAYFKKQGTGITNLKSVDVLDIERKIIRVANYIIHIIC